MKRKIIEIDEGKTRAKYFISKTSLGVLTLLRCLYPTIVKPKYEGFLVELDTTTPEHKQITKIASGMDQSLIPIDPPYPVMSRDWGYVIPD